ncbi:MAG: glycine zipper 2TM domain-containing protein [Gammaproteobacteria bacterium]
MKRKQATKKFSLATLGISAALLFGAGPALANGNGHHGQRYDAHRDCHSARHHHKRNHARAHRYDNHLRRHERSYQRSYYQPGHVVPVYTNVAPAYVQPRVHYGSGGYAHTPNFGSAVGGALGGFAGSKIGSGSGQLAATAAGAVIGYTLGGNLAAGH